MTNLSVIILVGREERHIRRAPLLFLRYAPDLDIIPAACDYKATIGFDYFDFFDSLLPSAESLLRNSYMLKEYIGYYEMVEEKTKPRSLYG